MKRKSFEISITRFSIISNFLLLNVISPGLQYEGRAGNDVNGKIYAGNPAYLLDVGT